jgi:hypothetical protein
VGFKRERVYSLIFDDPELNGLEVRARSASIGTFRRVTSLSDSDDATMDSVLEMEQIFAKYLVSWNLEDSDDNPVPATFEGLDDQDPDLVTTIIGAWITALTQVLDASPLDGSSDSGRPFPVESIPMETLSASRAS